MQLFLGWPFILLLHYKKLAICIDVFVKPFCNLETLFSSEFTQYEEKSEHYRKIYPTVHPIHMV